MEKAHVHFGAMIRKGVFYSLRVERALGPLRSNEVKSDPEVVIIAAHLSAGTEQAWQAPAVEGPAAVATCLFR